MNNRMFTGLITFLFAFTIMFATGCVEQQKEEPKTEEEQKSESVEKSTEEEPATTEEESDAVEKPSVNIPDLKGTWTGKFDNRPTSLKITDQESTSFKGAITINYREVINQQVSGSINPEKNTITMKDLLHSRYAGSYSGKLSEDLTTFSGTFTSNVDKNKFTFALKRK